MKASSQSGSAILWVLIGVILLAAVSTAVMRGSQTSTGLITDEQSTIYANQIIAYGNDVQNAVRRLTLRGNAENEINFYNTLYKRIDNVLLVSANPNSTSSSQSVYDVAGGGLTPFIAPTAAMSANTRTGVNPVLGHFYFRSVQVSGTISTANDIVLVLEGINDEVCKKINKLMNINASWPPVDDITGWSGTLHTFAGTGVIGDQATYLDGKSTFCIGNAGYTSYVHVIMNR